MLYNKNKGPLINSTFINANHKLEITTPCLQKNNLNDVLNKLSILAKIMKLVGLSNNNSVDTENKKKQKRKLLARRIFKLKKIRRLKAIKRKRKIEEGYKELRRKFYLELL